MRTTIRLDDMLLRDAKTRAAQAGRSLNEFIEDAVRLAVRTTSCAQAPPAIPLLKGGNGLRPGITLDSGAALIDVLEEGDRLR